LGGAETVSQRWRDRARLEMFRWTWWNTCEVAVGGALGVLLGALWSR
jgi:hypothetical protein